MTTSDTKVLPERKEILLDEETTPWVVFNIHSNFFAIDGVLVKEILPWIKPTMVPGLPPYFMGIIHTRGQLEGVADTAKILEINSTDPHELNRILMIRLGTMACGLYVEYVHDILDLRAGQLRSEVHPAKHAEFYLGEAEWDGKIISLLNGEAILEFLHKAGHE